MLEIIALIFLTRKIGLIAERKGLKPGTWKFYTVLAWFVAEIIGMVIGVSLFGQELIPLMLFGLFCAFGGYLFIHSIISKKPDQFEPGEPNDIL